MRKTRWISFGLALLIGAVAAFLEFQRSRSFLSLNGNPSQAGPLAALMQRAEWATLDARFKWRGPRKPDPNVVIIAVDDRSLKELHQWPWPRGFHAQLIRALAKDPPKALLFDIFFVDPFTANPAGDRALVQATRAAPWVVHSFYCGIEGQRLVRRTDPFPALAQAAHQIAYVNAVIDEDGVLRRAIPSLQEEGGRRAYLLSLVGASLFLNKSPEKLLASIPEDARGTMWVNFEGPQDTFPYVPYVDVLSGAIPPSDFAGKVVLVGAQATGTYDHYPTPLSKDMPGVEFHANIIDNLLRGNALRPLGIGWTYAGIALMTLFCGLWLARCAAWTGALWALGAGALYAGLAQGLFDTGSLVLDAAGPLGTLAVGYVTIVIYRFFTEEREKRWVKTAFGQYVSPKVLDILLDDPSQLRRAGERRDMTVLFSDVAGFTSISERLNPDELVVLLNRYLTAMTEVVFQYDGYLNKYMGDGIMAFWNAPLKQEDHPERACRCALESQRRLARLNQELESQGLVPLRARIGVNTGMMVVGNMGSTQKSDYTVLGDHVNIASRLEGANKSFGTALMISEFTYERVEDLFEVRFLDTIRVPGKARPVRTYELLGEKGSLDGVWPQALPLYHEAIQAFGARHFEEARSKFMEVLKRLGHDKACETYVQRSEAFIARPPAEDWDGVFDVTVK